MKTDIKIIFLFLALLLVQGECAAQGIVIYKHDGTRVKIPFAEMESMKVVSTKVLPEMKIKTFNVRGVEFKMIPVQGGRFVYGKIHKADDPIDEQYAKDKYSFITLSPFYILETEVTRKLWYAVTTGNVYTDNWYRYPWYSQGTYWDVEDFIRQINSLTGENFRLPTNAEWEFAARGGVKSMGYQYSGSDTWTDVAGTNGLAYVASKRPNELGIYDMSGNLWEWVSDNCYYPKGENYDPYSPLPESYLTQMRYKRGGENLTFKNISVTSSWSETVTNISTTFRLVLPAK